MRRGSLTTLVAAVALVCAGCASTPAATASSAATSPVSPASTASVPQGGGDAQQSPDQNAGQEAVTVAAAAVAAYCQPRTANPQWLNNLSLYLTRTATVAYGTVDPQDVPCTSVTGPASVISTDDLFTVIVSVPTDAGAYETYLTRPSTDQTWKVERMVPRS